MLDKALHLLGLARKGGNIAIGEEPVGTAANGGKARLIILAADAAGHTRRRAQSFADLHHTPVVTIDETKVELGMAFGRASVAMAALTDIRLAESYLKALDRPERYQAELEAVSQKAETMARRKLKKPRNHGGNGQ